MNKTLLLVALAAMSLSTVATAAEPLNFGRIDYTFRDYDGATPNQNGINLTVGREILPNLAIDGKTEFRIVNGTESISNRFELGATYVQPIVPNLAGFVRTAIGERFMSGSTYGYYSIEPGVNWTAGPDWSISTSYRFRDAFNTAEVGAKSYEFKVGTSYALDSTSYVSASVGRAWGDTQYNLVNVGYAVKF